MKRLARPLAVLLLALLACSNVPAADPAPPPQAEPAVFVTKTGKRYHNYNCGSLAKSKIPVALSEAKRAGFTPCQRCMPPG